MQPTKLMRPENLCYISWAEENSEENSALAQTKPFQQGKGYGLLQRTFIYFLKGSTEPDSLRTHPLWTDWLHEYTNEWRMPQRWLFRAQAVLQTPLSESTEQSILLSQAPSIFSFLHASWQIKDSYRFTVISSMEHSLLSALIWGGEGGGS